MLIFRFSLRSSHNTLWTIFSFALFGPRSFRASLLLREYLFLVLSVALAQFFATGFGVSRSVRQGAISQRSSQEESRSHPVLLLGGAAELVTPS